MSSYKTTSNWPNMVMIAGGLLMAVLWPLYITLHGPTSNDQDGSFLGGGVLFWGMMMNAPASVLFALGLGILLLLAFPMFLIPLDVFDQIEGYRIYGILAHLLFGVGWAFLGFNLLKRNQAE